MFFRAASLEIKGRFSEDVEEGKQGKQQFMGGSIFFWEGW
jgi:hypothetical protein